MNASPSSVPLTVDSNHVFEGHFCLFHICCTNITRFFVSSSGWVDISEELNNFALRIDVFRNENQSEL